MIEKGVGVETEELELEIDLGDFNGDSLVVDGMGVEDEITLGEDFIGTVVSYFKEKHNFGMGGTRKRNSKDKVKCDSYKYMALMLSDFDGEAIQAMANKGIYFTYLVRTPEELYRNTLSTPREGILVVAVGNTFTVELDNLKGLYYNAVHIDRLDYRHLKVRGISDKDCLFDEVVYINRFFLAHLLNPMIDWGTAELVGEEGLPLGGFELGKYELEDDEEQEFELDLG
jgi:hypothetical protein